MDAASVVSIIVIAAILLVLLAGVGGLVWWLVHRHRAEQARLAAMSPAARQRHDLIKTLSRDLTTANSGVRQARAEYEGRVGNAERLVAAAHQIGRRPLGSVRGYGASIELFEDHLAYATQGQIWRYPLEPSIQAQVDASGGVYATERSTLTRMAGGAAIAGRAGMVAGAAARKTTVHDGRELYLLVQGAEFSVSLTCDPNQGAYVRQFASGIVNASRNAGRLQAARPLEVQRAEAMLQFERENFAAIASADQRVAAIQGELGRLTNLQALEGRQGHS